MNTPRIEIMREEHRAALVQMLDSAGDLNSSAVDLYRRSRAMPDEVLVAWSNESLIGMLNASYNADLRGKPPFDLPGRPG